LFEPDDPQAASTPDAASTPISAPTRRFPMRFAPSLRGNSCRQLRN
jgi:hypothetical protein